MIKRGLAAALIGLGTMLAPKLGVAAPESGREPETVDRYDFTIRSETYAELFRRALLPGPNGALVQTETVAPVHEYVLLQAHDVDTSWRKDSIDVELGAWGRSWFGDRETERLFDGDIQSAYIRYRHGPLALRLGRQIVAGGAARFTRFDGLTVGAELGAGFGAEAYGGFSVLPRWNGRPGYYQLGAASDTLLKDPDALPEPDRSGYGLAGGRLGFSSTRAHAGVSFHEQHEEAGLSRRTLGIDGRATLLRDVSTGATGLFELEAERISDARIWVDTTPSRAVDVSVEYLHAEPALFLSRQSVLAVFTTDAYDEPGASTVFRLTDRFALEGSGSIQIYDQDRQGARGEIGTRIVPGTGKKTLVRLGYTRVLAVENGYHALRASIARKIVRRLSGTVEAYAYLYDESIQGRTNSEVYSGTLSYQALDALSLLWGTSFAQSPYSRADVQTLVRATYAFDLSTARAP